MSGLGSDTIINIQTVAREFGIEPPTTPTPEQFDAADRYSEARRLGKGTGVLEAKLSLAASLRTP